MKTEDYLIIAVLIGLSAFVSWFLFFRKPKQQIIIGPKAPDYAFGKPVAAYDVPGPTTTQWSILQNQSLVKVGV